MSGGGLAFKVFEVPDVPAGVKLGEAVDVYVLMEKWSTAAREVFQVIYLNAKNEVLHVEAHSAGDVRSSGVYPSEVFKLALALCSPSIILVHNHPSGDCSPSPADKEITASLAILGHMLGVQVLDHVIIGRGRFHSFQESGFLADAVRDGNVLLNALSVQDGGEVPQGCEGCGWFAGPMDFSRFHCWRRTKATAPEAGEVCRDYWPEGAPRPEAPVDPVDVPEWDGPALLPLFVDSSGSQLSLFGGEK